MTAFPETLAETLEHPNNVNNVRKLHEQLVSPNRVLPFVGAGLSAAYGYPVWSAYLRHHAKDRGFGDKIDELLGQGDFEGAAMLLKQRMGDFDFQEEIVNTYGKHRLANFSLRGASRFLHLLSNGPIITTNYDRVIEYTFKTLRKDLEVAVGAKVTATQRAIGQSQRILLKLHGDAEETTDRILSADDYARHYGSQHLKGFDASLPLPMMISRLCSGIPLLFLGCSLAKDRTMRVLHAITQTVEGLRHFALVPAPSEEADYQQMRQHLSTLHILPIWYNPVEEHRLLLELLGHFCHGLSDPDPVERLPAELAGSHDNLLAPNAPFEGRMAEKAELEDWLVNGSVLGNVYSSYNLRGAPGIGKTRLCQKVLSGYLEAHLDRRAFYFELTAARGTAGMLQRIAEGLGWPEEALTPVFQVLEQVTDKDHPSLLAQFRQVAGFMDELRGLFYFDNLEDVLDDARTESLLRVLSQMRHSRLLFSSRMALAGDIGTNVQLGRLDDTAAIALFSLHWHKQTKTALTIDDHARHLIHDLLDNHPLSIELVAAQADFHKNIPALIAAWKAAALDLASNASPQPGKQDSLEVSLRLSFEALQAREAQSKHGNLLATWALTALFPEGMSPRAQAALFPAEWVGPLAPQHLLVHYSVLDRQTDGTMRMLAPVRTYIRTQLRAGAGGLNWTATLKKMAEGFLLPIAKKAKEAERGEHPAQGEKYDALLLEFQALVAWVEEANQEGDTWKEVFSVIFALIQNLLGHRPLLSPLLLQIMIRVFERNSMTQPWAFALVRLGDFEMMQGNHALAFQHFSISAELCEKNQDEHGLAIAIERLGDFEEHLGNITLARQHYMNAFGLFEKVNDATGLANVTESLGKIEFHLGNLIVARQLHSKAADLFEKSQNGIGLANAALALGQVEMRLRNFDTSRHHYNIAIEIFRKEQSSLGLANAIEKLGDLELYQGNYTAAKTHYENAIDFFKKDQYLLGLANATLCLGNLEKQLGNLAQAKQHLSKAVNISLKANYTLGIANATRSLGDLEHHLGNIALARQHFSRASSLFEKVQDNLGLAYVTRSLGEFDLYEGNLIQAKQYFDKAADLFEKEQDYLGLATTIQNQGDLQWLLENPNLAKEHYNKAIELFRQQQSDLGLANSLKSLGTLALMVGDAKSASRSLGEAVILFDRLQVLGSHAQTLALIAALFNGVGKLEERDLAFSEALEIARASEFYGLLEYVENIGKLWLA